MLTDLLTQIFLRELETLRREIFAYPDEHTLWQTPPGIINSAGTLALHLAGNLRHYIGAQLGDTGYLRDREAEFSRRNVSRKELSELIDAAAAEVQSALAILPEEMLDQECPEEVGGCRVQTRDFLLHLLSHLSYHLGQIDYHRRMVTGQSKGLGAVAISGLMTAR